MSDYISRDETISTIWNVFNSYGNSAMHFEVEETKAIRKFCSRLQREIELIPTLDEKEIIRKTVERIVERLEERTKHLKDCTKYGNKNVEQQEKSYSTVMLYEVADLVEDLIGIVKEEGGIE